MPDTKDSRSLKSEVLELLHRWHPETVTDLIRMLEEKRGIKINENSLEQVLTELRRDGKLELEVVFSRHARPTSFLREWESTNDFWAIVASLVILNVIIIFPSPMVLTPVRWGLGVLAVLLFPGYSIQMCLFPGERELLLWKRVLLGIGLSIAAVGFYAVILDATTQGIVLGSVLIILTLHTLIFALIGLLRRYEARQKRA